MTEESDLCKRYRGARVCKGENGNPDGICTWATSEGKPIYRSMRACPGNPQSEIYIDRPSTTDQRTEQARA